MLKLENKILVHCCCGICAGYPLTLLGEDCVAFFYNPNIYPLEEYNKRLEAMKTLCKKLKKELIVSQYDNENYENQMSEYKDYKEGSERCIKCFEIRLRKTFEEAKKLGIKKVTTTLSVSPHKKYDWIKSVGEKLAKEFDIEFADYNFKKQDGFLKTMKIAKELELYRQNYCGCRNSRTQQI